MDSKGLYTLALNETRGTLDVAQRAARLSALLCGFDDLCASIPAQAQMLVAKLSYLFRQPEFPRSALNSTEPKDATTRLLKDIHSRFSAGNLHPKKTAALHEIHDAKTFFPFILSNVMTGDVKLSALVKPDGTKQWFARVCDLNPAVLSAVSFNVSGVDVKNYPVSSLKEKGISLLDVSDTDAKNAFMKEFSNPPERAVSNQIISASSAYVVPLVLRMKDRFQIRTFMDQLPDEPYLNYKNLPKQSLN